MFKHFDICPVCPVLSGCLSVCLCYFRENWTSWRGGQSSNIWRLPVVAVGETVFL